MRLSSVVGHAVLIWVVPFVAAFAFFTPEGFKMRDDVDPVFFKTMMMLTGFATACFSATRYFKKNLNGKGEYAFDLKLASS